VNVAVLTSTFGPRATVASRNERVADGGVEELGEGEAGTGLQSESLRSHHSGAASSEANVDLSLAHGDHTSRSAPRGRRDGWTL